MSKPSEDTYCSREDIVLLHYGELEADDRLRAESHLQMCDSCRRELAQLRAVLQGVPKIEPEFSQGEIRSFNERMTRKLRPKLRRPLRPALGWSLAAAAAVMLVVTLHSPPPDPQRPSTEMALQTGAEMERLPEPDLLLNLELLENLDLLQELEKTGISG